MLGGGGLLLFFLKLLEQTPRTGLSLILAMARGASLFLCTTGHFFLSPLSQMLLNSGTCFVMGLLAYLYF